MDELIAALIAVAGGFTGGIVGVGGGILFVPALTIFLGLTQVEGESTSLLMIVIVALVGAFRQSSYGNVNLRNALVIGALSPLGVLIGVAHRQQRPRARPAALLRRPGAVHGLPARAPRAQPAGAGALILSVWRSRSHGGRSSTASRSAPRPGCPLPQSGRVG